MEERLAEELGEDIPALGRIEQEMLVMPDSPVRQQTVSDAAGIDADALAELLTPLIDRALGRLVREGRYTV